MSLSQWSLSPSSQDSSSSVQASVQSSSITGSFRLRVDSCFEGEVRGSADVAVPMVVVAIFAGQFIGRASISPIVVHNGLLSFEG